MTCHLGWLARARNNSARTSDPKQQSQAAENLLLPKLPFNCGLCLNFILFTDGGYTWPFIMGGLFIVESGNNCQWSDFFVRICNPR